MLFIYSHNLVFFFFFAKSFVFWKKPFKTIVLLYTAVEISSLMVTDFDFCNLLNRLTGGRYETQISSHCFTSIESILNIHKS